MEKDGFPFNFHLRTLQVYSMNSFHVERQPAEGCETDDSISYSQVMDFAKIFVELLYRSHQDTPGASNRVMHLASLRYNVQDIPVSFVLLLSSHVCYS